METVYNQEERKWEEVKVLRYIKLEKYPNRIFFAHKNIRGTGYAVSEQETGSFIYCSRAEKLGVVIWKALDILNKIPINRFNKYLTSTLEKLNEMEKALNIN